MTWTKWNKVTQFDFTDIIYEMKTHIDTGGCVARVTINRPEVLNAFSLHTQDEVAIAFEDASNDRMIGVVVLTGVGDNAFSSGGDQKYDIKSGTQSVFANRLLMNALVRRCRKPIIAVVKGWAIGGGNHLAYMCDFTIAADNAVFGQVGPRVGSPADGYYVPYLTRVVGAKRAREMWMFCRQYDAQQALDMRLVNSVVPLDRIDDEVDRWCEEILSLSPTCIEILKRAFDSDIDYMDLPQGSWTRLLVSEWSGAVEEMEEGRQAFLEKRKPDFWKFRRRR